LLSYLTRLSERLRDVRVCCGDWSRVCGPTPTVKLGTTAVFLDPPYADDEGRTPNLYATDCLEVAKECRQWGAERGKDRRLRIALCGYEGAFAMPDGWRPHRWKAKGGYGSQSDGRGRENAGREVVWFSPHCLAEPTLFDGLEAAP
jgi:DNA adenine methylase